MGTRAPSSRDITRSRRAMTMVALFALLLSISCAKAANDTVSIHFFYGEGCPHCRDEEPFLDYLEETYPSLEVYRYETWSDPKNAELYQKVAAGYDGEARGVPGTFIGEHYMVGYGSTATSGKRIEGYVKECLEKGCVDPLVKAGITTETTPSGYPDLSDVDVCLVVFLNMTCSPCERLLPFLDELETRYNINITTYEVNNPIENAIYKDYRQRHGIKEVGFPLAFISGYYLMGEGLIRDHLPSLLEDCPKRDCMCSAGNVVPFTPGVPGPGDDVTTPPDVQVCLPFLGCINPINAFLPALTVAIALVDGVNPCTMWVLSFLLSMLFYARSRRRIIMVGLVYLVTVFTVYFMFMAAWLNTFLYIGYIDWIRYSIGVIAVVAGLINIKDFFWFGKGISLVIPQRFKPFLLRQMRNLTRAEGWALLSGTVFMALSASLIELPCTAGFPVIYTQILTQQGFTGMSYYLYLVLYNIVYIIPDACVLAVFLVFMERNRKITEREGRWMKLAGGSIMLVLGLIMLFKPDMLMFG